MRSTSSFAGRWRAVGSALIVGALSASTLLLTGPAASAAPPASNWELIWSLNAETGGATTTGGCNWISAGAAGDARSSRVWTEADATALGGISASKAGPYGSTSIVEKPEADGSFEPITWANKCQAADGSTVGAADPTKNTGVRVRLTKGSYWYDADYDEATIDWEGSFTVVSAGGQSYYTVTGLIMTLHSDGTGGLTGLVKSYAPAPADPAVWVVQKQKAMVLATFSDSQWTDQGFAVNPDFRRVAVTGTAVPQDRSGDGWGGFPQDLVGYLEAAGMSKSYYTTGDVRDPAKVPSTLTFAQPGADVHPPAPVSDWQDLKVTVPKVTGSIGWHIVGDDRLINMGTATKNPDGSYSAAGSLYPVEVDDNRTPDNPGWSMSAAVTDFANGDHTAPASSLGWTPKVVKAGGGAVAGAAVSAFGTTEVLGTAPAGHSLDSSGQLGADLALTLPKDSAPGTYRAKLTLTLVG